MANTVTGDVVRDERSPPAKRPLDLDLPVIGFVSLIGGLMIAGTPRVFGDGDVSWHIASGQWMLAHRLIPQFDPFSFTALGHRWIAHEWLSELVIGAAWRLGGFPAVGLLTIAAVVATLAIAGLWLRRWASPVELAAALSVLFYALGPFALARPMVLVWPLLAGWLVALLLARERGDRPPPWWTLGLMILWVNLHASFAVGILLAGAFGLEAVIASTDRLRTIGQWALYGAGLVAAAMVNPNGTATLLMPLSAFASGSITLVQEFRPTDMSYTPSFELALLAVIAVGWWRGARLAPVRILVMLAMLHLALVHMRHQTLFLIVGAMVLAPALTRRWIDQLSPKPPLGEAMELSPSGRVGLAVGAVLALALVGAARLAAPFAPEESAIEPTHGFAAIPPVLRGQPMLNEYSLGGPLILRGIRPYIDGRTDVYGDPFFVDYVRIDHGDAAAFARADRRWHFGWTMLSPRNAALIRLLDRSPEWRRLYSDRFTVIHVKRSALPH